MNDESNNEQQADSVTVDVQTGERSDEQQAPLFEIVEHTDGKKYIAADKVEEYRQHKAAELAAMQTEIDGVLEQIAEIDRINAVEERQAEMQKLIDQYGEDYDMTAVTDFENEAEFNAVMDYLNATHQSTFQDSSAGFGPSIESRGHSPQQWQYEQGVAAARKAFESRRR